MTKTSSSWTPEEIKDEGAAARRKACVGWGAALWVAAYIAGSAGSGGMAFWLFTGGALLFYIASRIKVWLKKGAEGAIYT
jgi:hypothetical protein